MKRLLLPIAFLASYSAAQNATVVSAAYQRPTVINVAPGQIITFYVVGIGAGLTKRVDAPSLPLPTSLAGISAFVVEQPAPVPVPILSVDPIAACADTSQPPCSSYTAVTVQIPLLILIQSIDVLTVPTGLNMVEFLENGVPAAAVYVAGFPDQIHVLRNCDEAIGGNPNACDLVGPYYGSIVTHADGSPVTFYSPAKPGEQVQIYAVGLGSPYQPAPDGHAVSSPTPVSILGISFDARPNALPSRPSTVPPLVQPAFAGLIPGYVGLYQINVAIPDLGPGAQPCYPSEQSIRILSNLTINIIGRNSFDGAAICVETPSK